MFLRFLRIFVFCHLHPAVGTALRSFPFVARVAKIDWYFQLQATKKIRKKGDQWSSILGQCVIRSVHRVRFSKRIMKPNRFTSELVQISTSMMNEWMTHTSYHTFNWIRLLILIDIFNVSIVLVDIACQGVANYQNPFLKLNLRLSGFPTHLLPSQKIGSEKSATWCPFEGGRV